MSVDQAWGLGLKRQAISMQGETSAVPGDTGKL